MGIWGMLPFTGRDPKFMKIVFDAAKSAAFKAYEDRREGSLYYGSIEVPICRRISDCLRFTQRH
jgi:hypothetical protein